MIATLAPIVNPNRRMRVQCHGATTYSRWLYRRCFPLGWLYYRLMRALLTRYLVSEDGGRTWKVL